MTVNDDTQPGEAIVARRVAIENTACPTCHGTARILHLHDWHYDKPLTGSDAWDGEVFEHTTATTGENHSAHCPRRPENNGPDTQPGTYRPGARVTTPEESREQLADRIETAMTDDGHRMPRSDETRYLAHVAAAQALTVLFRPDAPQPTDDAVERAARVLYEDACQEHDYAWEPNAERFRDLARAALAVAGTGAEEEHGPDWSDWRDDHPEEGPSCRCGFNGSPEECAAWRGAGAGWPEQIARAVAVIRAEAASYEAVSRRGSEPLYADDSDMPERMVSLLVDAGLITLPAAGARAEVSAERRALRKIRALLNRSSLHGDVPCDDLDAILDEVTP